MSRGAIERAERIIVLKKRRAKIERLQQRKKNAKSRKAKVLKNFESEKTDCGS
jgi:hypothetical protein